MTYTVDSFACNEGVSLDTPDFVLEDLVAETDRDAMIHAILDGLQRSPKQISSMYLYDALGSKLFEEITELPEYYLSRTERALLKTAAPDIGPHLRKADVIEIGSGDCSKISILLDAVPPQQRSSLRYIPVDISPSALIESGQNLIERFPGIKVHAVAADFMSQLPMIPNGQDRFFCFLGSTVGNLTIPQARALFQTIGTLMGPNDKLLLGVDMQKEREVLEPAYNDAQNVTARFNRNILNVINKLLDSDFDPNGFEHVAFYNDDHDRIEMHLKARRAMQVNCPHAPAPIRIQAGETIHTENSHKFSSARVAQLLDGTGLRIQEVWSDEHNWFTLFQIRQES